MEPDPCSDPDPLSSPVGGDVPLPASADRQAIHTETVQATPRVSESDMVLICEDFGLPLTSSMARRLQNPCPGQTEGWYVAFHAVLPGVSHGS